MRKLIAAAVAVAALVCVPLALAAGSAPTVTLKSATSVKTNSATLNGTVNPEGLATTYQFEWGTTAALGNVAPATATSAGAGTAAVAEKVALTGLAPDTTYYYAIEATNSSGSVASGLLTFKTTGEAQPAVSTGAPSDVQRYQATMSGSIVPNGATTYYVFQYGLTSAYGLQTATHSVTGTTAPVPVSMTLPGLQPGVAFHYRLVAYHSGQATVYGADQSFVTQPYPAPAARLTASVTPRVATRSPYRFGVSGSIAGNPLYGSAACSGAVQMQVVDGSTKLASFNTPVRSNCTYSGTVHFWRLPAKIRAHLRSGVRVTLRARYLGSVWAGPSGVRSFSLKIK